MKVIFHYSFFPLKTNQTFFGRGGGTGTGLLLISLKTLSHSTLAVTFIKIPKVTTEPMATINPVIPSTKKLYEKRIRKKNCPVNAIFHGNFFPKAAERYMVTRLIEVMAEIIKAK